MLLCPTDESQVPGAPDPDGHSSITVTYDRYGHPFPGSEAEAGAALEAYLAAAKGGEE